MHEDFKILKKTFSLLKNYKASYVFYLAITSLVMALNVFQPLLFGNIIDFLTKRDIKNMFFNISFLCIINLVMIFLGIFKNVLSVKISNSIEYDVKTNIFAKVLSYPLKKFDSVKKGEFMEKTEQDSKAFSGILLNELTNILIDIFYVFLMGFIIFQINSVMTIFLITLFPLSLLNSSLWSRKIRKIQTEYKIKKDFILSFFQESLEGFKTIKIYGYENNVHNKYSEKLKEINDTVVKTNTQGNVVGAVSQFIGMIGSIGILVLGIYFIFNDKLTLGGLIAFNSYSGSFSNSLFRLSQLNSRLQQALVSLKRILEITDEEIKEESLISYEPITLSGDINIQDLWFKYNDEYILKNINIKIEKNKVNAIAGLSGSGKTTLASIIMGLYRDYEGDVFIGETSYNSLSTENIIKNISLVTQESFLMTGSIKENIMMGSQDVSFDEVVSACKKAYIHDFIDTLPDKYETKIGYNGIDLSGGQRQRISIARALIKNTNTIIFDESTSSLDGESEKEIVNLIKDISADHTVILISHRLSTIKTADNITLIKNGESVGTGSHNNLIKENKYYDDLFSEKNKPVICN